MSKWTNITQSTMWPAMGSRPARDHINSLTKQWYFVPRSTEVYRLSYSGMKGENYVTDLPAVFGDDDIRRVKRWPKHYRQPYGDAPRMHIFTLPDRAEPWEELCVYTKHIIIVQEQALAEKLIQAIDEMRDEQKTTFGMFVMDGNNTWRSVDTVLKYDDDEWHRLWSRSGAPTR